MARLNYQEEWPTSSLIEFIGAVNAQSEAALCIAESDVMVPIIAQDLRSNGYRLCQGWKEAVNNLGDCRRVALIATPITREVHELFSQYNDRSGMVQILDRESFTLLSIHLPVTLCRLVVVTTDTALSHDRGSLLSHAGLIFRGESL